MCKYSAGIPTFNLIRMGLIWQVPTNLTMEEFAESLELPSRCGKVLKARKLNREWQSYLGTDTDGSCYIPRSTPSLQGIFVFHLSPSHTRYINTKHFNVTLAVGLAICRYRVGLNPMLLMLQWPLWRFMSSGRGWSYMPALLQMAFCHRQKLPKTE